MGKFNSSVSKMAILFFLTLLFVVPVLFLFIKSISFGWKWPMFIPQQLSLHSWHVIINDSKLISAIWTTVEIAGIVVIVNLLLGVPVAKALSRYEFKGKNFIETIIFLPILLPALGSAMGLHLTMIRLGLADQKLGVILIHLLPTLPYTIRILRAGYDRVSYKWEDQAKTLGANSFVTFYTITIPLLMPSIRSTALLTFVISLSQYVLTAIIGGGRVTTLPLLFYPYFNNANDSIIAAFAIIFAMLPVLFLVAAEVVIRFYHYLIKGM